MISKLARLIGSAIVIIIITLLVFILFEGFASTVLFVWGVSTDSRDPLAERLHTKYDPDLGWVNIPNTYIKDMYGPNVYLKINSQAFRSNRDFTERVPTGKIRVVCSGDSFTFGYGVDNDQTWCNRLGVIDKRLETVNMGQGGYGLGQAYLWYKRDGGRLNHNVHIFAFISSDIKRLQMDTFCGYAKPVVKLQGGALVTHNVPVPKRSFMFPYLTRNIKAVMELKSVELVRKMLPNRESGDGSGLQLQKTVLKIFDSLNQLNDERGSSLVVVSLPTEKEYPANPAYDSVMKYLQTQLAKRGIPFINLIDDIKKLPPHLAKRLFIPPGAIDYYGSAGHYTVEGNDYIADLIYEKMANLRVLPAPALPKGK